MVAIIPARGELEFCGHDELVLATNNFLSCTSFLIYGAVMRFDGMLLHCVYSGLMVVSTMRAQSVYKLSLILA